MFIIFLAFLFLGTGFALFRYYLKSRRQESLAIKKFDEIKQQLQEQMSGIDSLVGLLGNVHELGLETSALEGQSAIAKMVLDFACQITQCSVGSFMLMDKETNELIIAAAKGISDRSVANTRLKLGEGIAGRVAETGKTVIVDNIDTDARFLKKKDIEYRSKSFIAVPVKVKNRVIGVLNVHAEEPYHPFREREGRLLNLLADQSAITIENWNLYNNLQNFYMEMIETLARILELKEKASPTRETHSQVRLYARQVAQKLNLPESIIKHIEFAALMHGIGKIGIDDAILRKPTKLTEAEYAQMKKHPEIGKEIIAPVKFLSPVTHMVLYHQERWDGKGYPAGLKGEEIPLGSRIVAVINAYQAMISDRPYRKALTRLETIEELRRGAGTQFDPKVVDAFIRVLESEKGNQSELGKNNDGKTELQSKLQTDREESRKWS